MNKILLACIFLSATLVFAGEDRKDYNLQIEYQIKEYTRITYEEIDRLRDLVWDVWGDWYLSSQSLWVDYSSDFLVRKSVEFETGAISVETLTELGDSYEDFFLNQLSELISAGTKEIFSHDPLVRGIEERMRAENMYAVYADIRDEPVLSRIVTGVSYPSSVTVAAYAELLYNSGTVRTLRLENGKKSVRFDTRVNMTVAKDRFSGNGIHKKAVDYSGRVEAYGRQYGVPPALIYAVINNESSFNPFATSYIPAYGLMQLVPQSGGLSASSVIFGMEKVLSPSYLYDYDNNIRLGAIYLSQIYEGYFSQIKDNRSRLYCTISAYNTGAGNVARAFTGTYNVRYAESVINSMTHSQCYNMLMRNLPYGQTKAYLQKVLKSYRDYISY